MTHYAGNLIVTHENLEYAKTVESVGGELIIDAEGANLPALTSVGGGARIWAEGADLPALTSVGGELIIDAEGANLPALTSVGGGARIWAEGADLPALTSVGGKLSIHAEGADLPALTSVGGDRRIWAEGRQWKALHTDDRGYKLFYFLGRYAAGCRNFTPREALDHWGGADYPDPERGRGFVNAIKQHQKTLEAAQ